MSQVMFSEQAWSEYLYWQTQDKKTLKRINRLIESLARNDGSVMGKAEILKHHQHSLRSLRIDEKNRLIYEIQGDTIRISQVKGHYDD